MYLFKSIMFIFKRAYFVLLKQKFSSEFLYYRNALVQLRNFQEFLII